METNEQIYKQIKKVMKDKEYYSPEDVEDMFGYSRMWQIYCDNFHLNMLDFTTDYMYSDKPFCECLREYLAEHIANEMTKKELSVYLTND